jgi:hypothetical protein
MLEIAVPRAASAPARRRAGNATNLLVLLLLLVGLGAYNYHRNWQAEQREEGNRPFRTYSLEDLTALRDAYDAEAKQYERRYASQDQVRYRASGEGLMAERVAEFERIKRNSTQLRELGGAVAEREARRADIQREIDLRSGNADGLALHLRRLTTI